MTTVEGFECRHVQLASQRLVSSDRVRVVEDDILDGTGYTGQFDVLRAANILNHVYFDESILASMIRNLRVRLRSDGLMVICRTLEAGDTHGSIFINESTGLREIDRLGDGSEVAKLAIAATRD